MRITVVGAGYVGLTTAATLAYLGHQVTCVDNNQDKIDLLRSGAAPFYEPHLDDLLSMLGDNLQYTASSEQALAEAEAVFLAVGTPQNANGSPDMGQYWQAIEVILDSLASHRRPVLLVGKSTVPVGTAERVAKRLVLRGLHHRINLAGNPEFLRQGSALADNFFPYRFVFGGDTAAQDLLSRIYAPLLDESFPVPSFLEKPAGHSPPPVFRVDIRTAELSKYAANAFLAMKISFINEMANIAELVGADIRGVADVIGADRRIGRLFLNAGIGYGGSCFPKDTRALKYMADVRGYDVTLLSAVINVNNQQPYRLVAKLLRALGGLENRSVCLLGLTFKPETDDLRESPGLLIIQSLLEGGAQVKVHDPVALANAAALLPSAAVCCRTLTEALADTDAVVILTEWPIYRQMDPLMVKSLMRGNVVIDGRNCLNAAEYSRHLLYQGVGFGPDISGDEGAVMDNHRWHIANRLPVNN